MPIDIPIPPPMGTVAAMPPGVRVGSSVIGVEGGRGYVLPF